MEVFTKYTIEGFDQKKLVELGLNSIDAVILRWFVDFSCTGKMRPLDHDGKRYLWVQYQTVIDDLPILGINNTEIIGRHFSKFVDCGLMEKYVDKHNGTYTYFYLNPILATTLLESRVPPDSKVEPPPDSKVDTNNSSINLNSSIINIRERKQPSLTLKPTANERMEKHRELWNLAGLGAEDRFTPLNRNGEDQRDFIRILDVYSDEDMIKALDNYRKCYEAIGKEYRYKTFMAFIRKGVEKFLTACPEDYDPVPKKHTQTRAEMEEQTRQVLEKLAKEGK